jgi:hypothetical protein
LADPAAHTGKPWRRFAKFLPPGLGILVLAGIIFGLHGALASLRPGDIIAALAATPQAALLRAAGLLACSLAVMLIYDVPGILFARKLEPLPRLTLPRIGLASFCAYALSHVLGAPPPRSATASTPNGRFRRRESAGSSRCPAPRSCWAPPPWRVFCCSPIRTPFRCSATCPAPPCAASGWC